MPKNCLLGIHNIEDEAVRLRTTTLRSQREIVYIWAMNLLAPPCPNCGASVPFKRTQWKLGTPFKCEDCDAQLVIPRNYWISLLAFITFWLFKGQMQSTVETLLLLVGLLAGVMILSRIFVTPRAI